MYEKIKWAVIIFWTKLLFVSRLDDYKPPKPNTHEKSTIEIYF